MADKGVTLTLEHKLGHDETWEHIRPTPFDLPKYSVPALPFRWVIREPAAQLAQVLGTGYNPEIEPMDGWKSTGTWVLHPENQKRCLDAFWSAIVPGRSLCFFYAKAIPGVEDPRRVLIGAGFVDALGDLRPYINGDPNGFGAWIWERPVQHSVRRPDFLNGFVLPYHELLARAEKDASTAVEECVAFVDDEQRDEFSYATEHVTPDGALAALGALIQSVERMRVHVPGTPWDRILAWLNDRLTEVRQQRGACPGLGSALTAFGFSQGAMIATHLTRDLPADKDPWAEVAAALAKPDILPPTLAKQITTTRRKQFEQLRVKYPQRYEFLRLLSRFAISAAQARLLWNEDLRKRVGIEVAEEELLKNPYLLFERFRFPVELIEEEVGEDGKTKKRSEVIAPLSFWTIDRGVFLSEALASHHPLPGGHEMEGSDDHRRLRALVTFVLHSAAAREGHTLIPVSLLAERATALKLNPPCTVTPDLIELFEDDWEDQVIFHALADGKQACQLSERDEIAIDLRKLLQRARYTSGRLALQADWKVLLAQKLGPEKGSRDVEARAEKAAALAELASSRFSVLIGPAGTGKTTLLKVLCAEPAISSGGVLMLAPTGKARVRMQTQTGISAQTLAQFLLPRGRYETATGRYLCRPSRSKEKQWKTVIVDESSMLTEDQLAALLDALTDVDRFILVGDPSQLPPIGVGRPFVDLVSSLRPAMVGIGPRVAQGYAELTVRMRHDGEENEPVDQRLAELFSSTGSGDNEVLYELAKTPNLPRLRYVSWEHADDLREKLSAVLMEELGVSTGNLADLCGTLGASGGDGRWYFNQGAERSVESWQVLSPVRMHAGAGTEDLNRVLQRALRGDMLSYATGKLSRKFRVPKPAGPQQAVYGDKVINLVNRNHPYVWPQELENGEEPLEYVANGEIGTIIGETLNANKLEPWRPSKLQIAFGSQPGFRYSFFTSSLRDEGEMPIELAYAITVHKAQGSEFPVVFMVLPKNAATLCRELLYTALTRHKTKLIILGQGSAAEMLRFASASASATACRFTNITQDDPDPARRPQPVLIEGRRTERTRFYERYLIHLTRGGFLVRSKSEVIISNELDHAKEKGGLTYEYEEELPCSLGGMSRYPDFTVRNEAKGRVYYWEHLGMLSDQRYRESWKAKQEWYRANGILPWGPNSAAKHQLIVTRDGDSGEIDAKCVAEIVACLSNQ